MRKIAAVVLLSLSSSVFAAGTTYTTRTTHVEVVIPSHMSIDGQVYPFNPQGMRDYVDTLESEGQDELADKLRPKVEELEAQSSAGKTALWVGGGIGLGLMVYAAALPKEKAAHVTPVAGDFGSEVDANIENGKRDIDADGRHLKKQMAIGVVGIIALGLGIGINKAMQPSRDDLMGFVNLHNRKAKQYKVPKIEMNLGDNVKSDRTFSLAWSF